MKNILIFIFPILLLACHNTSHKDLENTNFEKDTSNIEINEHIAQNALDWSGIYTGVLPCADCQGIETTLIINQDLTYLKTEKYLGKESIFEQEGTFIWMNDGLRIELKNQNISYYYKVIENAMLALDIEGNEIEGELADLYLLKKQ